MDGNHVGDNTGDRVDEERLILSEVHLGNSALDESEVVSRYTYLTPGARDHRHGDTGSSSSISSSSDSEDRSSDITRRRKRHRSSTRSCRQRASRTPHEVLTVVHRMATTLDLVGQQVWSAAFLLGDFILTHEEIFKGVQVLELGAGPGVAGLVAARVARRCFLTDYHDEVLEVLARNVEANRHLFAHQRPSPADTATVSNTRGAAVSGQSRGGLHEAASADASSGGSRSNNSCCPIEGEVEGRHVVAVRKLDWFTFAAQETDMDEASCELAEDGVEGESKINTPHGQQEVLQHSIKDPFDWRREEMEGLCTLDSGEELLIVASDVIYDEGLTEALFRVLRKIMPVPLPARDTEDNIHKSRSSTGRGADYNHLNSTQARSESVQPLRKNSVFFLALEKRFNFSLEALSVEATGYQTLLRNVLDYTGKGDEVPPIAAQRGQQRGKQQLQEFAGTRVALTFPSCFEYERSEAMELWEIRLCPKVEPPEVVPSTTKSKSSG